MAKYYTLVTDVGRAKMANAQVMGEKVSFSQIALGSSETKPRENQTALGKEEWRGPISNVSLDKDNPNWIIVEAVVPSHVGGFEIAEVGVYDEEGHLIVVGNHPKTYKPKMDEGTTKDVAIRIIIEVSNSEIVELKVDPSVVIATRSYVESAIELAMASIDFSTVEKQIDQHVSNADIHVTAQDKKNWNAKETPSAAQAKATKALNDAKAYTDQQIGEIPEVDTSHLETKEEANKKLEKAKSYTDLHSERTDNPHKVTKSQVGLSNVDNVKQASKVDLDSHINDEVKHVTASERASWNAKETPEGAQAKATKALNDAKVYTDSISSSVGADIPKIKEDIKEALAKANSAMSRADSAYSRTHSLSSSTTSTSTTIGANSNAVKQAMDRANEAFTLGVKQKQATVDSLTSIGASLPSDPRWDELQEGIKKADYVREAEVTLSKGQTTVTLNFYPRLITGRSIVTDGSDLFCVKVNLGHRFFREGTRIKVADIDVRGRQVVISSPLDRDVRLHIMGVAKV